MDHFLIIFQLYLVQQLNIYFVIMLIHVNLHSLLQILLMLPLHYHLLSNHLISMQINVDYLIHVIHIVFNFDNFLSPILSLILNHYNKLNNVSLLLYISSFSFSFVSFLSPSYRKSSD